MSQQILIIRTKNRDLWDYMGSFNFVGDVDIHKVLTTYTETSEKKDVNIHADFRLFTASDFDSFIINHESKLGNSGNLHWRDITNGANIRKVKSDRGFKIEIDAALYTIRDSEEDNVITFEEEVNWHNAVIFADSK